MGGMSKAAQRAYTAIRDSIIGGAYAPGMHLTESELAEIVGVSRTPVHDALLRLKADGLIEMQRNQGARVKTYPDRDIDEIFELRAYLEGYGAELAAHDISDEDITQLEKLANEMEALGRVQDTAGLYEFARINSSFHKKIIEASGSIFLTSLLSQLIDMPLVVLKEHSWRGRANQHRSNQQHRNIIDALKSHDPKWARSVMYGHIISTRPHPESKP
nr:GntR family transcriptional regulator [Rhodospirillales bacterium]